MTSQLLNLKDQVAIVTGAARNIGFASAAALAESGAKVIICDIDDKAGLSAVEKLQQRGLNAIYRHMDVTNSTEVEAVVSSVFLQYGRLDIGVANAGICFNNNAQDINDEEWQKVVNVNLNGVFYCDRAFGRAMLKGPPGGRIINIGSISGMIAPKPQPQSHYNATKAAVHMLTKSLATEWAGNIRVNAIAPTYIETDITQRGMANSAWFNTWMEMTPMGRMGQPAEIASVVLFLASNMSSLMTGSVVVADAGYTCW